MKITEEILTPRLTLKFVTARDYSAMHALLSIPEVDRYNTLGIPASLEETKAIMAPLVEANKTGEKFCYGIHLKENNSLIGLFGISPQPVKYQAAEVWFKFLPSTWGQGFATEALNAVLEFCFNQLNLHRVEAGCAIENIASYKVMEKVGMQREGHRRQTLPLATGWSDNYEYAILASDWKQD